MNTLEIVKYNQLTLHIAKHHLNLWKQIVSICQHVRHQDCTQIWTFKMSYNVAIVYAGLYGKLYMLSINISFHSTNNIFIYRKQTPILPIKHIASVNEPVLNPREQMSQNRKTIGELLRLNSDELQVRIYSIIFPFNHIYIMCYTLAFNIYSLYFFYYYTYWCRIQNTLARQSCWQ